MTGNEKAQDYITVEIFNAGIQEIKTSIQGLVSEVQTLKSDVKELKASVQQLEYKTGINGAKLEMLQTSVYWGFAVMAFVVAYIQLRPSRREERAEKKIHDWSENELREMMREEFKLLNTQR
ncbi:MAG: hypothetical protein IJR94_08650 [Synergistaceae bacterium]|nr:hypothetical protein [Synergistaceae bacterium]